MKRMSKAQYYKDANNEWRWRIIASNGRVIGVSSESYKKKSDCMRSIHIVTSETTEIEEVGQ